MKKILTFAILSLMLSAACSSPSDTVEKNHQIIITDEKTDQESVLLPGQTKTKTAYLNHQGQETQKSDIETGRAQKINFDAFKPEIQQFSIDPKIESVLKTASGTKFIIPTYSFPGKEPVQINIREYFGKTAAYTQGLTTLTTAGEILESAGMFHIEAFAAGKKIDLRPGAEIILETAQKVDEAMGIYYGKTAADGNVYWEFDPLGTTPAPVAVMVMGSLKKSAGQTFSDQYKFDKAAMIALIGKQWKTSASFDRDGNIIGYSNCSEKTITPSDMACSAFFELLPTMRKELFAGNTQHWAVDFTFTCMTHEQFVAEQNALTANSELYKAVANFKPAGDGRKYFTIISLGNINIDKKIPIPDFKAKEDVLVKVENGVEEIKLLFSEKNTVISPQRKEQYYVFKNIPVGTEINVVSTYAKGNKVYYAGEKMPLRKGNAPILLSYSACEAGELGAKLAELCN